MKPTWYLNRLRKMSVAEVFKQAREQIYISYSRIKYSNPAKCHYSRFSEGGSGIKFPGLPGAAVTHDWKHYRIYEFEFDLTRSLDWFFRIRANQRNGRNVILPASIIVPEILTAIFVLTGN